jgi:hypothetical protein
MAVLETCAMLEKTFGGTSKPNATFLPHLISFNLVINHSSDDEPLTEHHGDEAYLFIGHPRQ